MHIYIHTYNHTYIYTLIPSMNCPLLSWLPKSSYDLFLPYWMDISLQFFIIFCRYRIMPCPFTPPSIPSLFLLFLLEMTFQFLDLCKPSYSSRPKLGRISSDAILHWLGLSPSLASFGTSQECHFGNQSHGVLHIAVFHVCVTCLTNQSSTSWA